MEQIEYRGCRPGDEHGVIKFFEECGYHPDEAFWRWINKGCPHGETIVEIAINGEQVIGHYSVLPRLVSVGGKTVGAGLAIHAAVHPQFRGLVILSELLDRIFKRCREAKIPFIYAFPNNNIWLVYLKLFRWQQVGDLPALELPLCNFRAEHSDSPHILVHDGVCFNERVGEFGSADWLYEKTFVVKDRAYLNWRYVHHPRVRYHLVEAKKDGCGLTGYLVLKLFEKHGVKYGHIVDLNCVPSSLALFAPMVYKAISWFCIQGVSVASCWMLKGTPFYEVLLQIGFQPTGFLTHMGYRVIDPDFPVERLHVGRWHTVMGDSDAF